MSCHLFLCIHYFVEYFKGGKRKYRPTLSYSPNFEIDFNLQRGKLAGRTLFVRRLYHRVTSKATWATLCYTKPHLGQDQGRNLDWDSQAVLGPLWLQSCVVSSRLLAGHPYWSPLQQERLLAAQRTARPAAFRACCDYHSPGHWPSQNEGHLAGCRVISRVAPAYLLCWACFCIWIHYLDHKSTWLIYIWWLSLLATWLKGWVPSSPWKESTDKLLPAPSGCFFSFLVFHLFLLIGG